jgi:hypothetical protein
VVDLAELRSWVLAFILTLAIMAGVAGLVWLCFAHPLGVLWVVVIAFIFIFVHKGQ